MRRLIPLFFSGFIALSPNLGAQADSSRKGADDIPSSFMRVYGETPPPFGFVEFCHTFPAECRVSSRGEQRFPATVESLGVLDQVNRDVNRRIRPATDWDLYGVSERWTLPRDKGDCEDYALLKRHILMKRGWPAGALLMTVVHDEQGEGHAVLTVRTSVGDFILDNRIADVRIWYMTPYQFVMRQSSPNPKVWVSLDMTKTNMPVLMANVRSGR